MTGKQTGDEIAYADKGIAEPPSEPQKQDQQPTTVARCVAKLRIDLDRIEQQAQEKPVAAARKFIEGHMMVLRHDVQELGKAVAAHGKAAKA